MDFDEMTPSTSSSHSLMEPEKEATCRVCGKTPGYRYYGSICCKSCKSFFLRAAISSRKKKCAKKSCDFLTTNCRACRYKKCLEVGMLPDNVGRRKDSKLRKKRARAKRKKANDEEKKETESISDQVLYSLMPSTDAGTIEHLRLPAVVFPNPMFVESGGTNDLMSLIQLERSCSNDNSGLPLDLNFYFNLNICVHDLIANPELLCSRVPIGYSTIHAYETFPDAFLARCFARSIVHIADWIRASPEVTSMPISDRIKLFIQVFPMMYGLQIFYYTHRSKNDGLLLGFGGRFIENAQIDRECVGFEKRFIDFFKKIFVYSHYTILPLLRKVELTEGEYVVLKNIVMFGSTLGLHEAAAEISRKARRKYDTMLIQTVRSRVTTEIEAITIVGEIMHLVNLVQLIAQMAAPHFSRLTRESSCGLGSQLTAEIWPMWSGHERGTS